MEFHKAKKKAGINKIEIKKNWQGKSVFSHEWKRDRKKILKDEHTNKTHTETTTTNIQTHEHTQPHTQIQNRFSCAHFIYPIFPLKHFFDAWKPKHTDSLHRCASCHSFVRDSVRVFYFVRFIFSLNLYQLINVSLYVSLYIPLFYMID